MYCQTASIKPSRDNAITTSNCTYGVVLNNCRSDLSGVKSLSDVRSVSVYGGEARISQVDVTSSRGFGIYAANMKQLTVKGCRFTQTASWGVYAHGRQLSVADSTFDRTKYGLYVRELSQTDAPVLRDLSFIGCLYGLRCDKSPVVVLRDNRFTFSNCVFGVTLIDCRSLLQGMDLSGSERPLNLYRGRNLKLEGTILKQPLS